MYIPIILGTGRIGRLSERVAKFLVKELEKRGVKSEIIDVRDYLEKPFTVEEGEKIREYAKKVETSNALIIVAPEYNHSYPGELKILLDSIYDEYEKKPVAICSVTSGTFGGRVVVDMLKLLTLNLGMIPIKYSIVFNNVGENFDEDGNTRNRRFIDRVEKMLKELIWWAKTMSCGNKKF